MKHRQGLFEMDRLCLGLTKWGLIIFNVAFWVMGVVSLAIGLWLYITANEFAALSDGARLIGAAFLVATGFGVIIVGFLGVVAAIWESRFMATVFCVLVVLALAMYVASGSWSVWLLNNPLEKDVRADLLRTISRYDRVPSFTNSWDELQQRFNCCGVDGASDWETAREPLLGGRPPLSCCKDPQNCLVFHNEGCILSYLDYEQRQLEIMGPIGLAFGLFQIVGVAVSILFCCVLPANSKNTYYT